MWQGFWLPLTRTAGGVILGIAVLLLGCQARLMYFPRAYASKDVNAFKRAGGREIEFRTSCGRQTAFYLPPREPSPAPGAVPDRLWLVCVGNGSLGLDWWQTVSTWKPELGWLFLDYPGYGSCEGAPNPERVRESAVAAVTALATALGTTPEALAPRMGVLGHSLGSAAALLAAEAMSVDRIVLIAPFTSMTDMARRVVGRPLCWLNRHRYDNHARLSALTRHVRDVHIFHGTEDEVIPCTMGRELALRHAGAVVFHEVRGATHMTVIDEAQAEIGAVIDRLSAR
jgi:pimeloyl-ACP methyl ester carboxylesterase